MLCQYWDVENVALGFPKIVMFCEEEAWLANTEVLLFTIVSIQQLGSS